MDQHRVRTLLPFLPAHGWEPHVLTVDPERQRDLPVEPELVQTLPKDTPVHRCGAVPHPLSSLAGIRNLGLRAWWPMRRKGLQMLRANSFDLVLISTTQFALFTLGPAWKRLTGVPYVLDLQDPIWSDAYEGARAPKAPGGWKYRWAKARGQKIERLSVNGTSGIVTVSSEFLNLIKQRNPRVANLPAAVIPFGYSEADFTAAGTVQSPLTTNKSGEHFTIAAIGAAGPLMNDAIDTCFAAVTRLKTIAPDAYDRIRLVFIGTHYHRTATNGSFISEAAARHQLADHVVEHAERVGYLASLRAMRDAPSLLVLGTREPGYRPSKLYPCLFSGRPVFAIPRRNGALHDALRQLDHPLTFPFDVDDSVSRMAEALRDIIRSPRITPDKPRGANRKMERFSARSLAADLAGWLSSSLQQS